MRAHPRAHSLLLGSNTTAVGRTHTHSQALRRQRSMRCRTDSQCLLRSLHTGTTGTCFRSSTGRKDNRWPHHPRRSRCHLASSHSSTHSTPLAVPRPEGLVDSAVRISRSLGAGELLLHALHPGAEGIPARAAFWLGRLEVAASLAVVGRSPLGVQPAIRVLALFPRPRW